jgi:Uma2 family endonuclease
MVASSVTATQPATLAELEALPENIKGEIIDGVLYTQPRPLLQHQSALGSIYEELSGPFQRGRGGPGGWWIVVEPGITAPGSPELSPDVAGWRRERVPTLPEGRMAVVPDWICEVHSPSTRQYDLTTKKRYYARIGVAHLWYVDLEEATLTAWRLIDGKWLELGTWLPGEPVRAEPFHAVELDIAAWWPSRAARGG